MMCFRFLLLFLVVHGLGQSAPGHSGPPVESSSVLSATAHQSESGHYDGIARALAACPTMGCVVEVEASYKFDAERGQQPTGPHQRIVDLRGGGDRQFANDVGYGTQFQTSTPFARTCLTHTMQIGDCMEIIHTITGPGIDNGTSDVVTIGQPDWTVSRALNLVENCQNAGICGALSITLNHPGIGDTNNSRFVNTWGGLRDGSGEGTEADKKDVGEVRTFYTGVITGSSAFTVETKPIAETGSTADIGVGQRLIDTTASSLLATGYVTGASTIADKNGTKYEVLAISGTVVPSTWMGTLDADIANIPAIGSTGKNTIGTLVTRTFTTTMGTMPAVGTFVNMAGQWAETVQVVSAEAGAGRQVKLGMYVRRNHNGGSFAVASPWGRGGFEFVANTLSPYRYDLDALGAIDSKHLIVVQYLGSAITSFNFARVNMNRIGLFTNDVARGTNAKGVVTLPLYLPDVAANVELEDFPVITISGASDPAFDGTCLHARNPVRVGSTLTVDCDQAASIGHSLRSGYVTLGDTGFGNTRFNLRPLAEVVDIQTYTGGVPTVTGTFRLEPNAMPLPVGGTVALDHDYAMTLLASHTSYTVINPYQTNSDVESLSSYGADHKYFAKRTRFSTPIAEFGGFGGTRTPPQGYWITGEATNSIPAVVGNYGGMDGAPWPSGSFFMSVGCPPVPVGCTAKFYNYAWMTMRGADGNGVQRENRPDYTPWNSTLSWDFLHVNYPNVPVGKGPMTYACFDAAKQLVSSPTPCVP